MRQLRVLAFLLLMVAAGFLQACAAGPRWVAGAAWTNNNQIINWYRNDVTYYVDAGPLSASVDHAAGVALVEAAASVWTVNGLPFSLADGGSLAEDVSGDNVYLGSSGPVWPADVDRSSYQSRQIAVVFDADGAITDALLGSGASAPASCRSNAVTETVDLFIQPGKIAHAIIIVNGRCTGSAPEQQLQLRYQLMRVFGRVIGLGWSQLNDNVFTGTPAPTYQQQMHWPIMHPIDILCGLYTYQCQPQPFTLRDDDVASLAMVYTYQVNGNSPGRITVTGWVRFLNGQGMSGVNMVAHRDYPGDGFGTEPFEDVSAVSGELAPGDLGNPVTGPAVDPDSKNGGTAYYAPGYFVLFGVPLLPGYPFTSLIVTSEPVNALYTGQYAVGPYRNGSVTPAGDATGYFYFGNTPGYVAGSDTLTPANAPYQCNTGSDGAENAPAPLPAGGVWSGLLCGVGHAAWTNLAVRAGRTATLEVTAIDQAGLSTTTKAMPVIGLWHAADATGTAPSLAKTAAFNATQSGMTQLRTAFSADEPVRFAIADQRGDGRPDYLYRARLLYADSVQPARLPPTGGTIRITGVGFQPGSTVTVGGVLATVVSRSLTELDAVAPSLAAVRGVAVNDVTVTDPRTGAVSRITGAITFNGAAADVLSLVTAPPATVLVDTSAPFAVRLVDSTGAPAANSAITVSAAGGQVRFDSCGLASCTLLTDSSGLAQARETPQAGGTVTLRAVAASGSAVQATFVAILAAAGGVTIQRANQYIAAGVGTVFHPAAEVTGGPSASSVTWTAPSSRVALGQVHVSGTISRVDAVGSLRDGETAAVQACISAAACATGTLVGVAASDLRVVAVAGDAQSVVSGTDLQAVTVRVVDTAGHAVAGATVGVYQRASGWQPPCGIPGRCPVAPVYGTSSAQAFSDDDGLVAVTPLQYSGTAANTSITVTAGTAGSLTVTLQKTP